ncbi:MAG: NAD(P)-dependent oxidoreductase [Candidatus Microsaccharimonas sp.]
MRVLIFGADGFIGRHVVEELSNISDLYTTTRRIENVDQRVLYVDLSNDQSVGEAIRVSNPDVIINCAGVIGNNADFQDNVLFTKHILEQASHLERKPRIILSGSASSYGFLRSLNELPVSEDTPLRAEIGYGLSKKQEEELAVSYADTAVDVVVLRIFNPIGVGMAEKLLLPNIVKQLRESDIIEVSRLDAKRDYIDVRDVAKAFAAAARKKAPHNVYNVGSGRSVSTREIIAKLVEAAGVTKPSQLVETQEQPERLVASQADIRRIKNELEWEPEITIEETLRDILNHESPKV